MPKVDVTEPSEEENFDITSDEATFEEPVSEISEEMTEPEVEVDQEPEQDSEPEAAVEDSKPVVAKTPVAASVVTKSASPVRPVKAVKAPNRKPGLRLLLEAVLVIAIIVLAVMVANLRADKHDLATQLASANSNPQALVQRQTDDLIAKVATLMQLPTGETPTVAAVSDANAAKQQSAFFNSAQNGDKVLLYVKAGEAILYRPSTNKIVLVAPLTFNSTTKGTTSTTPTTSKTSTSTTTR